MATKKKRKNGCPYRTNTGKCTHKGMYALKTYRKKTFCPYKEECKCQLYNNSKCHLSKPEGEETSLEYHSLTHSIKVSENGLKSKLKTFLGGGTWSERLLKKNFKL